MKTKEFFQYTIYEDGTVINNTSGKEIPHRIRNGRKDIRLYIEGERKNYTSARLIYCVFNDIDINKLDKNECISFKDNDKCNIHLDNLKRVFRGDLIQGDGHTSIVKLNQQQAELIKRAYYKTLQDRPINQYDKQSQYNSYRGLAKEYGVTYTLIKQIVEGNTRDKSKYKLHKEE